MSKTKIDNRPILGTECEFIFINEIMKSAMYRSVLFSIADIAQIT